jgi:hypothetical protein
MSDVSQGPGWWQASDGKWYPPELRADYVAPLPPPESAPTTPQPWWRQIGAREIAIVAIVVAILAGVVLTFQLVQSRQRNSETPTIATSSAPTLQPAPAPAPIAQPPSTATPIAPISEYLKTQWGTICVVTAQQVTCQVCIPGEAMVARQVCTDPAPGRAINPAGTMFETAAVTIDSSSGITQLSDGDTSHAFGWTIVGADGWARFINDATGHGAALAPQNYSQI